MSFITVPNIDNSPLTINTDNVESFKETTVDEEGAVTGVFTQLNMVSRDIVFSTMPYRLLSQLVIKASNKPKPVQTTQEWAG